jgi:hypothetical protein
VADFARWHRSSHAEAMGTALDVDGALAAVERAFAMRAPRVLCTTPSPRTIMLAARRRTLAR